MPAAGEFASANSASEVMVTIRPNLQFGILPDGDFRHDCRRFALRAAPRELIDAGQLGMKSGAGFYDY
jgi:3-hydroxyacyl-CoA dehydrogenase